jgi:hypothetical protein
MPVPPNAFALDLFGFDVSTFPPGAAGALSFHDPLEGTETKKAPSRAWALREHPP